MKPKLDPLESSIEKTVVDYARKKLSIKVSKLQGRGQASAPDRVFWLPGGRPLLIEFKRKGKEPTMAQAIEHSQFRELDYDVYVCDNVEQGKELLRSYLAAATRRGD